MTKTLLVTLFLLLSLISAAFAGNKAESFTLSPIIGGYTFDGIQHLETRPVYGLRFGYNYTANWGVEALFDYVATSLTGADSDADAYRYGFDLLYHFLPGERLVPFAAAGLGGTTVDYSAGNPPGLDKHDTDPYFGYGGGVKYSLTDCLALRGDIRHVVVFDEKLNLEYTVGLTYAFGGKKAAAEPAPVEKPAAPPEAVPEPPLEPVPAAEPAPGRYKYCITLKIEFDIDKADIRPEYHDEVAKVGDFMKQFPDTTAVIEGHSDNVGDPDHNLELSRRRAESVAAYLTEKFGIDAARLSAKGYGMGRPVADNATDEGKQKNRRIEAIIDCALVPEKIRPAERLCVTLDMEFDVGNADVKSRYHNEIARVAKYLKNYPETTALIEGHTDNVGGTEFNMKLSQQRADTIVGLLVEKFGIDPARLSAKGYGDTRRIAYNATPEGRQKNRRINAVIECVLK